MSHLEDQSPAKVNRSDLYWFNDGNVILQAEETLYRVHSFMFARHCGVFKDMFSIPQPSVQTEADLRIEGCPVIPLTDKIEDVENLISLLYDNNKTHNFRLKLPVALVASMLRLGRKYAIPHLENEALARLYHDYPKSLKEWDALIDDPSTELIDCDTCSADTVQIASIIALAHEFQLYTVLPAAYSSYLYEQYLSDIPSDNDIVPEARGQCLIGHSRILIYLKKNIVEALSPPLFLPARACTTDCRADIIKELPVWQTDEDKPFGIFQPWSSEELNATKKLCPYCEAKTREYTDKIRKDFWAHLPSFFSLPAWEDLKDGE